MALSRESGIFSRMSTISKFYFDKAKYYLADVDGNQVFMAIDYKGGKFKVIEVNLVNKNMRLLKNQAQNIAANLILRKRNVNFSDTIRV